MRDYIKSHLGPELRAAGLSTQICVGDDNTPALRTFVPPILGDPAARAYVSGVAVHDYAGEPNTGTLDGSCCDTQFMAPPGNLNAFRTTLDHYLYGHLTKWVRPGAVRVGSDQTSTEVSNVAFRDPDGTVVVVVVVANGAGAARSVAISSPDGVITDTLPTLSVATYRWAGGAAPADSRLGTFRLVNLGRPGVALLGASDLYPGSADSFSVVASPTGWNSLEQRWTITSAGSGYYRLTASARPWSVLHTAGEKYLSYPDVWATAATPGNLRWDEQLWQIADAGSKYWRLVNKARGTVLQLTSDRYRTFSDVYTTASSPGGWNLPEQQWRLVPG